MDLEAVNFLGQPQFQVAGDVLAKLSNTYGTVDLSLTTLDAFELHLVFSTGVITFQNQNCV